MALYEKLHYLIAAAPVAIAMNNQTQALWILPGATQLNHCFGAIVYERFFAVRHEYRSAYWYRYEASRYQVYLPAGYTYRSAQRQKVSLYRSAAKAKPLHAGGKYFVMNGRSF